MKLLKTSLILYFVVISVIMIIQDFKSRHINLFVLILFVLGSFCGLMLNKNPIINFIINVCIVSILLTTTFLVFYFRYNKDKNFINKRIGLADVILFYAFTMLFSNVNFVLFLNLSFFLALFISLLFQKHLNTIPLAGFLSITYLLFVFISFMFGNMNYIFQDDYVFYLNTVLKL